MQTVQISTVYKFKKLEAEQIFRLNLLLTTEGARLNILGLFLLGPEGINTTFCGTSGAVNEFKEILQRGLGEEALFFKDSYAERPPFHDLKVKIKNEIVTYDRPGMVPTAEKYVHLQNRHLSPAEWERTLNEEDVVVLDTRNDYEFEIGRFKNAVNPRIEEFTEFRDYLQSGVVGKKQKVLIYCTGGIRCEKALLEMDEMGFENVYQLDGGILNYLKEYPNRNFEGECFVFDYRVAVDQNLQPSKQYRLCPHCGEPAAEKITCIQCGRPDIVCSKCLQTAAHFATCSKNCAHHNRMGHNSRRLHHDSHTKRTLP